MCDNNNDDDGDEDDDDEDEDVVCIWPRSASKQAARNAKLYLRERAGSVLFLLPLNTTMIYI